MAPKGTLRTVRNRLLDAYWTPLPRIVATGLDLAASLPTCSFPPASVSGGGRSLWFGNRHP